MFIFSTSFEIVFDLFNFCHIFQKQIQTMGCAWTLCYVRKAFSYSRPTAFAIRCTICDYLYNLLWANSHNLFYDFGCNELAGFIFTRCICAIKENFTFRADKNVIDQWLTLDIAPAIAHKCASS